MDPINYTAGFSAIPSPIQAFTDSFKTGAGIQQVQQQQQQQQAQMQRMQQMQQMTAQVAQNPTPQAIAQLSIAFPEMSEQFKRSYDMQTPIQQQSTLNSMAAVYAAVQNGQNDIATQLLNDRATALSNSGDAQGAKNAQVMSQWLQQHPDSFKTSSGVMLATAMGPDKFAAAFKDIGLLPAEVQKAQADATKAGADATKAGAEATVATQTIPALIAKPSEDIATAQSQRRIAELNTQIAQANSETERGKLVLERDKLTAEMALKQQTQGQGAQDAQNATTNALQTLGQIKTHPGFKAQDYGGTWSKFMSVIPGTDRQALQGWVDSLKDQLSFQNLQAMKSSSPNGASGLGALSDGERKMLSGLAGNLDLDSKDFPKQLAVVERSLQKAQATSVARGQLPQAGEAVIMQHPQFGVLRESDINNLMKKHPGATRQQVIDYLNQPSQRNGASGNW